MVIKEEIWSCSHVVTSIDNRHIHTWLQESTSRCKLFLLHVAAVAMVTGLHTSVNKTASLLLGKISQLLCFVNSFLSMNLPDNDDLERFLRDVDQMSKCCLFTNHSRCYAAVIRKCNSKWTWLTYLFSHEINVICVRKMWICCFLFVDELVKQLNSSDVSCQEKAIAMADQFISSLEQKEPCKTKINKTVINKNPSSENRPPVQYLQCVLEI